MSIDYEPRVQAQLEQGFGYRVKKIPGEGCPDFLVWDSMTSLLIELKTKLPSDEQIEARARALGSGQFHVVHEKIARISLLSDVIRKAVNQLDAYKHKKGKFRLVWLITLGHLAEPRMLQFEAALYGSTYLTDGSQSGRSGPCYFFHNSDFFNYRGGLDGAIVSTTEEAKLLLNPLSPRYERFKESTLLNHFPDPVDPERFEGENKAFIADGDVDRNNKQAVLDYLRQKYDSDSLFEIELNHMSGTTAFYQGLP